MSKSSANVANVVENHHETGPFEQQSSQAQVMGTQVRSSLASCQSQLSELGNLHNPILGDRHLDHQSQVPLHLGSTPNQSPLPPRFLMSQVRNFDQGGSQVHISQGSGISSNDFQFQRRAMGSLFAGATLNNCTINFAFKK